MSITPGSIAPAAQAPAPTGPAPAPRAEAQTAPPGSSPTRTSGCAGCLRGCLVTLALILVLAVIGVIAAATVGRAYAASNLPRWEAANPWLTFALDTTGLREKIVSRPAAGKQPNARQPGQNDRSLLPADLPLPADALLETYSIEGQQVTAYQELAEAPADAAASLDRGMQVQGWQRAAREEDGDTVRLSWTKAGRACQAEFLAPRGVTELWLRCGTTGK